MVFTTQLWQFYLVMAIVFSGSSYEFNRFGFYNFYKQHKSTYTHPL